MRSIFCIILFFGCQTGPSDLREQARQEILQMEMKMSRLATEMGFHAALLTYAHDSLVKPEEGRLPVIGRHALDSVWSGDPGTKSITWKPFKADASSSGDMGYSIGTWTYETPDTTLFGTYNTIWKKDEKGKWKWVLDGGNNTPAPPH